MLNLVVRGVDGRL